MTKITPEIRGYMFCLKTEHNKSNRDIVKAIKERYNIDISPSTVTYHMNTGYRLRTRKRTRINYRRRV